MKFILFENYVTVDEDGVTQQNHVLVILDSLAECKSRASYELVSHAQTMAEAFCEDEVDQQIFIDKYLNKVETYDNVDLGEHDLQTIVSITFENDTMIECLQYDILVVE